MQNSLNTSKELWYNMQTILEKKIETKQTKQRFIIMHIHVSGIGKKHAIYILIKQSCCTYLWFFF
jgi:plasmid maintenance system antidote protein VapI